MAAAGVRRNVLKGMRRWLFGVVLGCGVAALAYWRRALTLDGALAAVGVGGVVFARGGGAGVAALLAFFASSSALSRLGERRKRQSPLAQAKGARRDAWQVLANGGVATLCLAVGGRAGRGGFVGALAAAGADTWATELGLLARGRPRLVTTLKPVQAGTSGGVTAEGLLATLAGASVVALAWRVFGGHGSVWRGVAAGMAGSLVDSLLGATVQALYRCPDCEQLTEEPVHGRCGAATNLVRGQRWL
ncbi:MAG TPA: DUF92 domain-containing protein, partial [Chloroflexota bacterium]|nr:DUF92 domain-containing protein [Chloroflexota bacterium]